MFCHDTDSFGELDDNNDDDLIELPEETVSKPVAKSRRGRAGRVKTKSNTKSESKPNCDDLESDNDDVKVAPGLGQKTAFKKLSKLKGTCTNGCFSFIGLVNVAFGCFFSSECFRLLLYLKGTPCASLCVTLCWLLKVFV